MLCSGVFCQPHSALQFSNQPTRLLSVSYQGQERLSSGIKQFSTASLNAAFTVQGRTKENVLILSLVTSRSQPVSATEKAGIFFMMPPTYRQGLAIWRYKPWNSWTKPMAIAHLEDLPDWDVQFFYWRYADGLYGAAVPLSGSGFRTTIGGNGNRWGTVAVLNAGKKAVNKIPALAVAFGRDPYELFSRIYRIALTEMGFEKNQRRYKKYPDPLNYIGWCSWNSSALGKNLNGELLLNAAKSFHDSAFSLGWLLIDDGWFNAAGGRLRSMQPDSLKFPQGFAPVIKELKQKYAIKYMGIWHALDGYWNGIDSSSVLGMEYRGRLFSWKQKDNPDDPGPADKTYYFIKPQNGWIGSFYQEWHRYLKEQGFDFLKVDNQLVVERMAVDNYPVMDLAASMHSGLNASVSKYFGGSLINCMDMTADAYLNFGNMAVARCSEDYFPYSAEENYNLQHGNAAAHVMQAVYNSIYFGQMVYPDFDMFQSHNPNAVFHAIARAINNGPIYITDVIGSQQYAVLRPLVYHDGKIIHSTTNLVPTADCLFSLQSPAIFKAFSKAGSAGLLGIWNMADTSAVYGSFKPSDVSGMQGNQFALYEYFSGWQGLASAAQQFPVSLGRLQYKLYYIVPVIHGFAAFGLVNKYNGPATILNQTRTDQSVSLRLYEGGQFKAYSEKRPQSILVNGQPASFAYDQQTIALSIPGTKPVTLQINW